MLNRKQVLLVLTWFGLMLLLTLSDALETKKQKTATRKLGRETQRVEDSSPARRLRDAPGKTTAKPRLKSQIPKIKALAKVRNEATNSTKKLNKLTGPNVCGNRCCSGWAVALKTKQCTKPRCFPRCVNRGICKHPNMCICRGEFEGPRCEYPRVSQAATTPAFIWTSTSLLTTPRVTSPPGTALTGTTTTLWASTRPPQSSKKPRVAQWQPLTLKEAQLVLLKKSLGTNGRASKLTALLSKHVETEKQKALSNTLLNPKGSSVKTIQTSRGEYTIYRIAIPASNQSTGAEKIKVLFTPTICKVRCTQGRCTNFCEKGNITTLYSTDHRRPTPGGPGFRVFLCPLLCNNGGVCIHKDVCLCPPTFTGKFCQIPIQSSTNEIEKPPSRAPALPNQQGLTQSEYTLPLQNHESQQSVGSPVVKVRVQHPPEASVKIHQVLRVGTRQGEDGGVQDDATLWAGALPGTRNGLLLGEKADAPLPQIQAQTVRGNPSYSESSGFKYCFREILNGQCSSPLPGLRTQETCCRGVGLAWGIQDCTLCPSSSGNGANGDRRCPMGFQRINGTQCVAQKVISEDKGQCYRLLTSGFCSLPILRNITKQICCCSRVGKAWGRSCERCPHFGSAGFKEICPAGPGYHYSPSTVKINQRVVDQAKTGHVLTPWVSVEKHPTSITTVQPARAQTPPIPARTAPTRDDRRQPVTTIRPVRPIPVPRPGLLSTDDDIATTELQVCQVSPLICGQGRCIDLRGGGYTCLCNQGYKLNAEQTRCQDVDECQQSPSPCSGGRCENIEGTFRCNCPVGYRLGPQGKSCTDINECENPGHCPGQECVNSRGSYRCVPCRSGYRLQNGRCSDINECENPVHCPGQECVNSDGSYRCVPCRSGYRLQNGRCSDINECENPGHCPGQECVNSDGSYRCVPCRSGYRLQNGRCSDINECENPVHCPGQECVNSDGSYRCVPCRSGYRLQNGRCSDINECDNPGHCPGQECVNSDGSYRCVPCRSGYRLQNGRCSDINECENPGHCPGQECVNSDGSYRCVPCRSGYRLQNGRCSDINECENPVHCPGQECVNSEGSYRCVPCRSGYRLQNGSCSDVDECQDPLTCGSGSRCVNNNGSFRCECKQGFRMDSSGRQCRDINECLLEEFCFPHGECLNTDGSYQCLCAEGFKTTPDGGSCVDVDECARPGLCQDGRCINTEGSFECQCQNGFTTNPEKNACLDVDECADTRGEVCHPQRCENTIGSYHCITTCEPGLRLTASGECVDIDECANKTICGPNTICQNLFGLYQCTCERGFKIAADERQCVDINECESLHGVCGDALCENVAGSFLCNCPWENEEFDTRTRQCLRRPGSESEPARPGFSDSSLSVNPPDATSPREEMQECYYDMDNLHMCHKLSLNSTRQKCCCTIGEGWGVGCQATPCPAPGTDEFQALCPYGRGFVSSASSLSFKDVDECKDFEVCKNGVCVNDIPGYTCYCTSGYYFDSNLLECIDNNECEGTETCPGGTCINTMGSYYCHCEPPLVLDFTQTGCMNTTLPTGEFLDYCWQEISEDLVCQQAFLERQVTFQECCCRHGKAWSMNCALCPDTGSDMYEKLCSQTIGEDYSQPYGPDAFVDYSDYHLPDRDDYPPPGRRDQWYRGRPPSSYGLREGPYGRRSSSRYDTGEFEPRYTPSEPESPFGVANPLTEPSYEARPRVPSRGAYRTPGIPPDGPPFDQEEPESREPWLRFRPREVPSYPEFSERQPAGGLRRETFERRNEPYVGLHAEECGIVHGCENGRCIRIPEGYTCDCYDGYQLDMTTMACIDINECDEADDPNTMCVNGQCLNTDGSYECVCLRGFVMSRQSNYCIPAQPRQ
ncbi:latent-transforming growth factor beta-binding protein 4 isoform X2 [Amia ocellicauda]|uniref:latent-transforming growth factor beta-binding protein 4 isoform X2 n=1 Tax=Amia ocellicauda TaxID=2972642 RepID=UPI0034640222